MSMVASRELDALVESLRTYSPQAVRAAIEAARDPGKAAELVGRLEALLADDPSVNFAATGICVALGEAKAAAAAPVLLTIATHVRDVSSLRDAALYALMRMGEPAFDEAMRFIRTDREAIARIAAYQALCAAGNADEPVRQRVADFCFERAPLEMDREPTMDEWHPGHSACEVLVWLRDPRVLPLLETAVERDPDDPFYETLLDSFECEEEPEEPDPDWREDWPDYCDVVDEALALERDDYEGGPDEANRGPYAALLDDFARSDRARGLSVEPQLAAGLMNQLINLGTTHLDEEFSFENVGDVREALLELLPRKVMGDADYFGQFPAAFEAFVHFLHERGTVKDPGALLELAAEVRTELPKRAADPSYWGIAKRMFTHQGLAGRLPPLPPIAGFDLDSVVRQVAKAMDVDLDTELREQPPAGVEPVKPIRRESPKVGRNDPCPCGSGKKYKKCCGA